MKSTLFFRKALGVLSLAAFSAIAITADAQVSNYSFSQSVSTYTPITGGTVLGDTLTDNQRFKDTSIPLGDTASTGAGLPIGFTFNYNGANFDRFGIDANGWIALGNGSVSMYVTTGGFTNGQYSPISSAAGANYIAAFARNLQAQGGSEIRFETSGVLPNRVLTVQWTKYRLSNQAGYDINFQIQLFETSNVISVVYGTVTATSTTNRAVQVGLRGSSNADFNNRTTTTNWNSTTSGAANNNTCSFRNTIYPASGLVFTWTPPAPCTAPPTAGNAVASPSAVCPGANFKLSLSGSSVASGLSYQWESSPNNLSWNAITSATSAVYNTSQSSNTYYRCQVTCSGISVPSGSVLVTMNPIDSCYCSANLHFFACDPADNINTVSISGTSLNNANTGCTGTNGNGYTIYPASGSTTASMQKTAAYTISVTSTADTRISAWIDYDRSGTYDVNEWIYIDSLALANNSSSASLVIPNTAVTGLTRMRVRSGTGFTQNLAPDACANFFSGETEDYLINITAAVPCSGTPTAGTVNATVDSACFGNPVGLSLSGNTIAAGITYQWQSSTDNSSWGNITGATSPAYTDYVATNMFYRCVVSCSANSATTPAKAVGLKSYINCYCEANLHSQPCTTTTNAINSVVIDNTTLNNPNTGCTGSNGNSYVKYPATGATTCELTAGNDYTIRVATVDTSKISMWIDYDHSGTYEIYEWVQLSTMSLPNVDEVVIFTVPSAAMAGAAGMRIRNRAYTAVNDSISSCSSFGSGETEDYVITIKNSSTSVAEGKAVNNLMLYPNPASDEINLSFSYQGTSLTVRIVNVNGQVVYAETRGGQNGLYRNAISLRDFTGGLYMLQVVTDKGVVNRKLIKN